MIARARGATVLGLLSLAVGVERFVNAALVDGVASYSSTRFIVGAASVTAGSALLVLTVLARRSRHRVRE